ncbi:MAG: protein translocase subunit SecF [Gammaproteobacteria bacterium]
MNTPYNIDFMGKRRITAMISGVLLVASILSLSLQGLNLGIDFTGGTIVEIGYQQAADLDQVRQQLLQSEFSDAVVQYFGTANDILIRIPPLEGMNSADVSNKVLSMLGDGVEMRRVEFVGPQVGEELKNDGGLAMLYALVGIFIYVALRFQRRFSMGAIAALVHDVVITIGLFSIFKFNFDLAVLAAILAVIGYSLNDTIVVFDRVRENFHKLRETPPVEVFNISLNETLSRTIVTGLTTLLVLIALLIFGGETIKGFSIALISGIVVGTYSSIYVASPVTLALGVSKEDLMPVKKEGAELDDLP